MAIDPNTLEVGETLYDKRRYRMGNTTMSHTAIYTSRVVSVEHDGDVLISAMISWNTNPAEKMRPDRIRKRFYRFHPKPHREPFSSRDYAAEVKEAAETAAEERAAYRARVKAKKAAAKAKP
jgi:hypothetical protein